MNVIYETKPAGQQWNVVTMMRYKKRKIDHNIYIKVLSDVNVYYISVSTNDVLNTTNNELTFTDLRRVLNIF